ncbi:MAG: helix-turn-helix transcriptional regulator [Arachnia propionica]|uniref:helix-turn-helix transcriptional regulator n=1 Tax=Arachnia propionica TaxID=1750 RepID=UPI002710C935|nr:helix-turn-helix transcriptional regulator [Arachnia propionica]
MSIAPAIIAREFPGWPTSALGDGSDTNVLAHLIGRSAECELTIISGADNLLEETTTAADDWLPAVLARGVSDICIDDRGMFRARPDLAFAVEKLVRRGVKVVVVTDHAEDEFALVAQLSHLRPQLLLQRTMTPEEIWRIVEEQTGSTLDAYREMILATCVGHPLLVHLFLTALCHVRNSEPISVSAVANSLADAITHVVQTQFSPPEGQVTFLLHLALRSDPQATEQADQALGNLPLETHNIRQLATTLATEQVPQHLLTALWSQLRIHLEPELFDTARRTLLTLLDSGLPGGAHHSGILELLTGETALSLTPRAAEIVLRAADRTTVMGQQELIRSLPDLLEDKSLEEVAARLALLYADVDIQALGEALQILADAPVIPQRAYELLSPLVTLEYPALTAKLAERALETLSSDDPHLARVVLAWIMSSPATACAEPGRRRRVLRRIVTLAHSDCASAPVIRAGLATLRAFTQRSMCWQLRELTADQSLSSGGLPVLACCLAGLATSLNGMTEQAAVWCWRARALARTHATEHVWVLITHALVAYRDHDKESARDFLTQAEHLSSKLRASSVSHCCKIALQHFETESTRTAATQSCEEISHAVLRTFALYCEAVVEHKNGSTQTAIEKHFSAGQTLESSSLTNPRILDWQHQLKTIFLARNDKAVAECLHNDMAAAEKAWQSLNGIPLKSTDTERKSKRPRLSRSEWRVAEQIAAGCTNAQAASALFLSKRTIDTHLRNIYRRLGLSGREELIDFFRNQQDSLAPDP